MPWYGSSMRSRSNIFCVQTFLRSTIAQLLQTRTVLSRNALYFYTDRSIWHGFFKLFVVPTLSSMKLLAVAAVLFFCISSLQAQTISLGPTAGFGHSYLKIKDSDLDSKFFPAYNFGAKLVYSIKTHWGISADLRFSGEGGKLTTKASSSFERKYRADYIRIPFQGIYFFGKLGDAVRPKIALGPSLGFLIGGKTTESIDDMSITLKTKDVLEGFDFGVNASFGANFRLKGDKWINADITWYHGITNISGSVSNIKNRNIGFNIGLLLPFNDK